MLPTGHFELAPLDEFVVTEHKRERIGWHEFCERNFVGYEIVTAHKIVQISSRKPPLVDVYLNDADVQKGWRIVWLG